MFALAAGLLLTSAAAIQTSPPSDPCAGDPSCRQATAAQIFGAADALAAQGDLEGAERFLEAVTEDPDPDLRAEARFRLAAVRERMGNLSGAEASLRALLSEKPQAQRARLELARLLALQGKGAEAEQEFSRAESRGLPDEVLQTVRRFSTALSGTKRRGASIEFVVAPDSNVNRATTSDFVDTVIAPFQLDADAREQAGIGTSLNGEAWSRDALLGATVMSRAALRADIFPGKSRFNDVQILLSSGPEFSTSAGRIRPSGAYERRWFGQHGYATGYGPSLNWIIPAGARSQIQIDASAIRQTIDKNRLQDGWRYGLAAALDHAFDGTSSARLSVRTLDLEARVRPESLRQSGGDLLLARVFASATVFVQIGYTRTDGLAPILLFGKARHDDRLDIGGGVVARGLGIGSFAPVVRLVYTDSRSNLTLYDYRRARLELGFTRAF